jgi:acyl-[acyl carrier protein]--UDP-N-acetylglucosamine O-acyltransferase
MNKDIYIPSNFSIQDVVDYIQIPENVRKLLETAARRIDRYEDEIRKLERYNEALLDQNYHCREFIFQVKDEAGKATKVRDLKKFIEVTLENSYIEL